MSPAPNFKKVEANVKRTAAVFGSALTAYNSARSLYEQYETKKIDARRKLIYRVSIKDNDQLYRLVYAEVFSKIPTDRKKNITASLRRRGSQAGSPLTLTSADEQTLQLEIGQFRYTVNMSPGGYRSALRSAIFEQPDDGRINAAAIEKEQGSISFECDSMEARDHLLTWIERLADAESRAEIKPRFYVNDKYGGWNSLGELDPRPIDSVVLPSVQKDRIVEDIERFLSEKERERYHSLGLPWHRGYLLHGPPGTGKTSLAKALANHFRLNLFYVPLNDIKNDTELLSMVSEVTPRSVLLLEDIDVFRSARERKDDDEDTFGVTLSGLLNALDGVVSLNGVITVMTTNNRDVLDPALIRPGRVDMDETIGYLIDEQLQALWVRFYDLDTTPSGFPKIPASRQVTPAEIVEIVKRNWDDPAQGLIDLTDSVTRK